MPAEFTVKSTDNFLKSLHSTGPCGFIAPLDVKSLSTNGPVEPTFKIICDYLQSPGISSTQHPPHHNGEVPSCLHYSSSTPGHLMDPLFLQQEGVAMSRPIGLTFLIFYMYHLGNNYLQGPSFRPATYSCRYVDDIYVVVKD